MEGYFIQHAINNLKKNYSMNNTWNRISNGEEYRYNRESMVINESETKPAALSDAESHRYLFDTAQQITGLYLLPMISCIGIFGNVCNVLVFTHSKKYSTNAYLIALSLSDILKLANDFVYFLVNLVGKIDQDLGEHLFKSLYLYSHYIFVLTAINTAWLTCIIAIDRYITVSSRNQVKTSEANYFKSILISVIITLLSCLIALPSPLFLKSAMMESRNKNALTSDADTIREHTKKFYNYFNAAFRAIIPIILLIYLNYKIIRIVYENNKTRKHLKSKPSGGSASSNGGVSSVSGSGSQSTAPKSRVTTMLLVIIFSFVFCVFPDAILTMMHLGYANENYLIRAIREVTDVLLAINSATTFFICYLFSMSYRLKFKHIFSCKSNGGASPNDLPDDNDDSPVKQERLHLVKQKSKEQFNNKRI